MAVCNICNGEMLTVKGCTDHLHLLNDQTTVVPIRVGAPEDWLFGAEGERCGDCNASIGETHHVGCDMERCRLCGGQFISCSCDYSDKILVRE